MSQQYKDVLTTVGLTVDQIEKLEAGELKPQEAAQSIQEFTTTLRS